MVAVIAAVGGEVEGDGQALLPGRQVAAVEGVRFLRRREAGILPDRPGLLDVHGRVGAAQIGRRARPGVQIGKAGKVRLAIGAGDGDVLRRQPPGLAGCRGGRRRLRPGDGGEIGNPAHAAAPLMRRCAAVSSLSAGVSFASGEIGWSAVLPIASLADRAGTVPLAGLAPWRQGDCIWNSARATCPFTPAGRRSRQRDEGEPQAKFVLLAPS